MSLKAKLLGNYHRVRDEIRENEQNPEKMKFIEYVSFALGRLSFGSIRHLAAGYRQEFYMTAGIEPARAALLVFSQTMFDAICDPTIGSMIDRRKNTSKGRFKPFIAPLVVPLALLSMFMFSLPGFVSGPAQAFAWFFLSYALWEVVNTAAGTSFDAIATVMSADNRERTLYTTIGAIGHQLAGFIPGFIPAFMELVAIDRETNEPVVSQATFFMLTAVLFGILGVATGLFTKNLKERVSPDKKNKNYIENLRLFFRNKNLLLLWTTDIPQLISHAAGPTSAHFYTHVVGNRAIQTIQWTVAGVPHFLAHLFAPFFLKRFRPSRIIIACTMANGISFLLLFLIGRVVGFTSWLGFANILFFASIGWVPAGISDIARRMLQMNTLDYTAAQTGKRAEATSLAAFHAGSKLLWAVAALLGGLALQYIGFAQDVGGVMQTQSPQTLQGLATIFALFPAIGNLLGPLPMFFFKLEGEEFDRRMAELHAVNQAKEEIAVEV